MKMTYALAKEICDQRFAEWTEILARHNATPLVLIGVEHGENSGDVHLQAPEGVPPDMIVKLLRKVAAKVEADALIDGPPPRTT